MIRRLLSLLVCSSSLSLCACFGTPTPLAPQLRGSIGLPHDGVQTDAVELPQRGPGFVRYRPYGSAYFAQPELVNEVQAVARQMAEQMPGPALVLGDLSGQFGGKIPRHNSHRSGRDVDLLWYVMTPDGRPVPSPGFIHLGPDGLAQDPGTGAYYRLDVARQWLAVKTFLESDAIFVQWMFCSSWVEAILIEYARARGESDELIWRAETVMLQPREGLPHDDHIHLRISCTPDTMVTGCAGGGPYWEWLPEWEPLELEEADLLAIGEQDPLLQEADEAPSEAVASGAFGG